MNNSNRDCLEVATSFIDLVVRGPTPTDEVLAKALDELVYAYHVSPSSEPADADPDPPGYPDGLYHEIAARFPDYGYYAVADPAEVPPKESMVGDAIDDLADIVRDLQEVIWRAENVSEHDARWHFRLLYQIHWGRHARELSLYLHDRQWG